MIGDECVRECRKPCIECKFVENKENCTKCLGGYTISSDGECIPDVSCNYDMNCEVCPYETVWIDSFCAYCKPRNNSCLKCSSEDFTRCVECKPGYFLMY